MDLDFSFTLVSSLTPRSKVVGTPQTENKYSSTSLRSKLKKPLNNLSKDWQKSEKENFLPEDLLMNNNESSSSPDPTNKYAIRSRTRTSETDASINVDLANVAVRRNRFRDRRKENHGSQLFNCSKLGNNESSIKESSKSCFKSTLNNVDCVKLSSPLCKKGTKRKSPDIYEIDNSYSGDNYSVLIEDSVSDTENVPAHKKVSYSPSNGDQVSLQKSNNSGLTDQLISPAYSMDFSIKTRRRGAKVIPETPETDESFLNNKNTTEKVSLTGSLTTNKNGIARNKNETVAQQISSSPKLPLEAKVESSRASVQKNASEIHEPFVNKKNIKKNNVNCKKNQNTVKQGKIKPETPSPVLKELNSFKDSTSYIEDKNIIINNASPNLKFKNEPITNTHKTAAESKRRKSKEKTHKTGSKTHLLTSISHRPPLIPPSEVISKFEHITNWLKSTEQKSVISVNSEESFESPKYSIMPPKQVSKLIGSLSPRIKRKMKVAKSSFEEEQKLFEELYGDDGAKRLDDELEDKEDVLSGASFQEPLEISEKVLDKLYGSVWQKHTVIPQSEPKKKSTQKSRRKPQTERKKKRTSIFDVFSSSSSEDRFEEFLENVRRGKIESKQQNLNNGPSPPEFINDSDSESNCSLTFYQNIVSSAVKDDVHKLTHELHHSNKKPAKVNRRRLSFTSSKDGYSESGKTEAKSLSEQDVKNNRDKKTQRHRTKKNVNTKSKVKDYDDVICFDLVTPIKISNDDSDKCNVKSEGEIKPILPKSVTKLKTPRHNTKSSNNTGSEEGFKGKSFGEDVFKMPTSLRTPVNSAKKNCPSSPALSFLSSLSEVNGGLPCHPDAIAYKKDFKNKKEELTKKLFSLYNKEVFDCKLPADMLIQWNTRMTSTSGYCYNKRIYRNNQIFRSSRIVLSTKILDRADRLRDTLIHELCHAATWIVNETSDGHGPKWRAWADRANRRFPELPLIKRCHDYAISTKYTYKCMSCGYCIGRHSKSLNTDRKRCGFCYGKFQVFVTAKMATSSVTSGSDSVKTQRTPTGFALFVKENYAAVKKENKVPHAQVMKLLSQKFAEFKITKTAT